MDARKIINRARANILKLKPYQSARLSASGEDLNKILLNANENPYIPFSKDLKTDGFNRYPEPQPEKLKKIFADLYKVGEDEIVMGRGSDEAIDILIRAFCEPKDDAVVICSPTFGMYEIYAQIQGADIFDVKLDKDNNFQLNMVEFEKLKENDSIKIIFIPNPSAPLGHSLVREDILKLCEMFADKALVVVDEAYIDFSEIDSFTNELKNYSNLVVLKTLSKAYAMAGLRIGVCIADSDIINLLKPVQAPYPLTASSINYACEILQGEGFLYAQNTLAKIIKEREEMLKELSQITFIKKVYPTCTNFIFIEADNADKVISYLKENNFILRSFTSEIKNGIRISIGTPEQNKKLISLLKKFADSVV